MIYLWHITLRASINVLFSVGRAELAVGGMCQFGCCRLPRSLWSCGCSCEAGSGRVWLHPVQAHHSRVSCKVWILLLSSGMYDCLVVGLLGYQRKGLSSNAYKHFSLEFLLHEHSIANSAIMSTLSVESWDSEGKDWASYAVAIG